MVRARIINARTANSQIKKLRLRTRAFCSSCPGTLAILLWLAEILIKVNTPEVEGKLWTLVVPKSTFFNKKSVPKKTQKTTRGTGQAAPYNHCARAVARQSLWPNRTKGHERGPGTSWEPWQHSMAVPMFSLYLPFTTIWLPNVCDGSCHGSKNVNSLGITLATDHAEAFCSDKKTTSRTCFFFGTDEPNSRKAADKCQGQKVLPFHRWYLNNSQKMLQVNTEDRPTNHRHWKTALLSRYELFSKEARQLKPTAIPCYPRDVTPLVTFPAVSCSHNLMR